MVLARARSLPGGALAIRVGTYTRAVGSAVSILNTAHDAITSGRISEAEPLLDYVEATFRIGDVRRVADIDRAAIASLRGDLAGALARLDAALARPVGPLAKRQARAHALGAREHAGVRARRARRSRRRARRQGGREERSRSARHGARARRATSRRSCSSAPASATPCAATSPPSAASCSRRRFLASGRSSARCSACSAARRARWTDRPPIAPRPARADWPTVLAHCEQAMARARANEQTRVAASDIHLPQLACERAIALAALGRAEAAAAELALVEKDHPAYPHLSRDRLRVRLVLLVRRGDFAAAGRLTASRPEELPLSLREELLAHLVRAVAAPESAGAGETAVRRSAPSRRAARGTSRFASSVRRADHPGRARPWPRPSHGRRTWRRGIGLGHAFQERQERGVLPQFAGVGTGEAYSTRRSRPSTRSSWRSR